MNQNIITVPGYLQCFIHRMIAFFSAFCHTCNLLKPVGIHKQRFALLLFAFAFAMAGMNPTAVASAGKMTSATSIGVMLPAASSGAIIMPWVTGIISQYAGLSVGMASNIVPCIGLLVFAVLVKRVSEEE